MLLISDLHLTDKEADKYRWEIWAWVAEYYQNTNDKTLVILGDLTDAKDHHSSSLVNGIVSHLLLLCDLGMEIFILKGNHDYIDPDRPFFAFLAEYQFINYIVWPSTWVIQGHVCLFLPHTRDPIGEWKEKKRKRWAKAGLIFMHQSVIGSVTSNGYLMTEGLPPSYFKRFSGQVISGDIHVPQTIGPVTYVGSPYSVRFNDSFEGRGLAIDSKGGFQTWHTKIAGRRTLDITNVEEIGAPAGYQVKVRVHTDANDWPTFTEDIVERCKLHGLQLCSIQLVKSDKLPLRKKAEVQVLDPAQVVKRFGKKHSLSKAKINIGSGIVE